MDVERVPIEGSFGYEVDRSGRVFSTRRRWVVFGREFIMHRDLELKLGMDDGGYRNVGISYIISKTKAKMMTKTVHRLVAEAFIPNPDNKPQVNHLDGDKSNNNDWNLEWATESENMTHCVMMRLNTPCKGQLNGMAKLNDVSARKLIRDLLDGMTNSKAAIKYRLNSGYVSLVRHKHRWGVIWDEDEFKDRVCKNSSNRETHLYKKLSKDEKDILHKRMLDRESLVMLSKEYHIPRGFLTLLRGSLIEKV